MNDTAQKIENIVNDINKNKNIEFTKETDLFSIGILDSFGMIEYISMLEKAFDISINNADLIPQNLWSVDAAKNMVERYL